MSLRINTNVMSLSAQRHLEVNRAGQDKSLERLSSGSRINHAGDDAAGLAISEKLKSHIRSMKQATRNANDGVSMIQVAEGAMNEVGNILTRLRELSIQGASDTIGDVERGFIDKEVQALKNEIERIGRVTDYNGTHLLDGTMPTIEIQVGIHNKPFEDRFVYDGKELVTTIESLGLAGVGTTSKEFSRENLSSIDAAITKVSESRSALGALQNRLYSSINNGMIYSENLAAANSRIRDTDMAEETSELTKSNILTQSTISVLGQANALPQSALKLIG